MFAINFSKSIRLSIRFFGIFLIFTGVLLNQLSLTKLLAIPYVSPFKSLLLLAYNLGAIILGVIFLIKAETLTSIILKMRVELSLLVCSILFVFILLEIFLRICIFMPYCNIASFNHASYYSNMDHTDYWYFRNYVFNNEWEEKTSYTRQPTYLTDNLGASIKPDGLLGFSRKKNADMQCAETSNFGTRSIKNYTLTGKKILFYGNSFTESLACSNDTITSKIEKKINVDTLNYGIAAYSLDQAYLLFKTTYNQFNNSENIILIGMLESDIDRMMLKARLTPKPYYTIENNELQLHTEHIEEENIMSYYANYKPRTKIYSINFLLGRLGVRDVWNLYLDNKNIEKKKQLTRLLLDEILEIKEKENLNIKMVLFYHFNPVYTLDPGNWRREFLVSESQKRGIDLIDLKECLTEYSEKNKIPLEDMFWFGHPTSEINDVLVDCILDTIPS